MRICIVCSSKLAAGVHRMRVTASSGLPALLCGTGQRERLGSSPLCGGGSAWRAAGGGSVQVPSGSRGLQRCGGVALGRGSWRVGGGRASWRFLRGGPRSAVQHAPVAAAVQGLRMAGAEAHGDHSVWVAADTGRRVAPAVGAMGEGGPVLARRLAGLWPGSDACPHCGAQEALWHRMWECIRWAAVRAAAVLGPPAETWRRPGRYRWPRRFGTLGSASGRRCSPRRPASWVRRRIPTAVWTGVIRSLPARPGCPGGRFRPGDRRGEWPGLRAADRPMGGAA